MDPFLTSCHDNFNCQFKYWDKSITCNAVTMEAVSEHAVSKECNIHQPILTLHLRTLPHTQDIQQTTSSNQKTKQSKSGARHSRAQQSHPIPGLGLSCRLGKIRGRRMYMYLQSLTVVLWLLTASLQIPRCDFPKDLDTVQYQVSHQ
jgi:hypothetical protein